MIEKEKVLSEVNCPVTDAKFILVKKEIPESINFFSNWSQDILHRVNANKSVNIAIDCEGHFLGCEENSLSCIQIGKIFDDSFDIHSNETHSSVGKNPGFIILKPLSEEVIKILSSILNNGKITKYTFDFTSDFASMMEAGIKISMKNVFDSEVSTQCKNTYFTKSRSGKSLTWFVEQAQEMDPLGKKAFETKNRDKKKLFLFYSIYI